MYLDFIDTPICLNGVPVSAFHIIQQQLYTYLINMEKVCPLFISDNENFYF